MTDAARSRTMRAVRSADTAPERLVRGRAHRLGFRFRLHRRDLPGCPDIVFPGRGKAIFVNGCFWHGHDCKRGKRAPKTNAAYWREKVGRNRARDARNLALLEGLGWSVLTLWECELKDVSRLDAMLLDFLGREKAPDPAG